MSGHDLEETLFRSNLLRSHQAVLVVAYFLRQQGHKPTVPELRIRPRFEDRHEYSDGGKDIIIERGKVEVKWRRLKFTCAADFPYTNLNVDRANKQRDLAVIYFSTNESLSHAAIVDIETCDKWLTEQGTDPKRGYSPYAIYRCPIEHIRFVALPDRYLVGLIACSDTDWHLKQWAKNREPVL